jgi:GT2 family glycosyltransferase
MPVIEPVPSGTRRPFWSVMIPCFNSATLLARTLESVLAQDPGPDAMQIEVVDDASTADDPSAVVDKLGAGRVELFRQPRNAGAPANFTTCVRRARGEWVHVLHSDDVVLPRFYERYGAQLAACPDALMVGAQTITVDAEERYVGVTPPVAVDSRGYLIDAACTIATRHPLAAASAVVSRRAYETVGGFHPGLAHTNDWEMWTRVALAGHVAWVREPLALYRAHPDSDSSRLHRSTAYLDECEDAVDVIAGQFDEPDVRRRVRRGARRAVGGYAVAVGLELVERRDRRLALANAARAVRIDPSIRTWSRAAEVAGLAISSAVRDRR